MYGACACLLDGSNSRNEFLRHKPYHYVVPIPARRRLLLLLLSVHCVRVAIFTFCSCERTNERSTDRFVSIPTPIQCERLARCAWNERSPLLSALRSLLATASHRYCTKRTIVPNTDRKPYACVHDVNRTVHTGSSSSRTNNNNS